MQPLCSKCYVPIEENELCIIGLCTDCDDKKMECEHLWYPYQICEYPSEYKPIISHEVMKIFCQKCLKIQDLIPSQENND